MDRYYFNTVIFAENPASADEIAIAEVIKNLHQARREHSMEQIISFYDENAVIQLLPTKFKGTRKQYEERTKVNIKSLRSTYFGDIFIQVVNEKKATVSMTACYRYVTYTLGPARLFFEMEKKDNQWRIIESEWVLK